MSELVSESMQITWIGERIGERIYVNTSKWKNPNLCKSPYWAYWAYWAYWGLVDLNKSSCGIHFFKALVQIHYPLRLAWAHIKRSPRFSIEVLNECYLLVEHLRCEVILIIGSVSRFQAQVCIRFDANLWASKGFMRDCPIWANRAILEYFTHLLEY